MPSLTDIAQMLLPLLFCGDEITDILYLVANWDSFGNQNLKNSAIAFTLINAILNFFCTIPIMTKLKSLDDAGTIKKVALICFCAWMPVFALTFLMLYSKFFNLAGRFDQLDKFFEKKDVIYVLKIAKYLEYSELFLQDIPQIVIQSVNNTMTSTWGILEYMSLVFSVGVLTLEVCKFMFCRDERDQDSDSGICG